MNTNRKTNILPRNHRAGHQPWLEPGQMLAIGQIIRPPPRNIVVAMQETVTMFTYSARKNMAHFSEDAYSVWNPPTSSDSASARSNGARLVSPTMEMQKITKLGSSSQMYQPSACASTIPAVDMVRE